MIVATAGHVDHGKTSLVKALTQVDTDRLAEEKRRGMSIDIGFAYADFGDGLPLGFVDVPGHERFVRNMLAGVASIDLALLVVAADDGPMPQTREHVAILGLLGVPQCVVVLTKIDRAGPQRAAQVEREVAELLARGPYRQASVFAVVPPSGEGVPALRAHLAQLSRTLAPRATGGEFRLAVDRSFALAGAGRVVTGAVLSGSLHLGDTVIVSPEGTQARVRSIHAQGQPAQAAHVGQRCALNLTGPELKRAPPQRGDWVVAGAAHAPTQRIDVRISVLASEERPLARGTQLHLHIGAAALSAQVATLEGQAIAPGESALAQLVLEAPIAAVHGERFILRDPAAHRTVGGGLVLDPFGPARGRSKPARAAQLAALSLATPEQALAALLQHEPAGVNLHRFAQGRNLRADEAAQLHRLLEVQTIEHPEGLWGLSQAHWQALRAQVLGAAAAEHAEQPDRLGVSAAALGERLGRRSAGPTLRAALDSLVNEAVVVREGLRFRLATHRPELSAEDSALLERVAQLLRPAGLRPPIVGELATVLALAPPVLAEFLVRAGHLGQLVRVAPNRFFLPETVAELVRHARQLANETDRGDFDAAAYRDRTAIGRNLTVQVLEFMDREGLTRFDGARRKPLP